MSVRIDAQAEPIPGYRLLSRLGSGGFGEVWKAEAPGGIQKAVKVIFGDLRSPDRDLTRFAEQELKALNRVKQVRHPYLLSLDRIDVVEGRLLIVMELADRNLWDRFKECRAAGQQGIPRDELLGYMAEVAEVLDLMNDRHSLQHLDIKPQNLFLLHTHVKVADFGQVKDLQGMVATVTGGITPVYAAPETFDGVVTKFCDQYSLACVYQELLTGRRPFDGASMAQLLNQHLQLPPDLQPSPAGDRKALARALAKDPADRWPTVTAFVQALRGNTPAPFSGVRPMPAGPASGDRPVGSGVVTYPALRTQNSRETPPPAAPEVETAPPFALAHPPTEETGTGAVRPALVVGLGGLGVAVVRRLRAEVASRFGGAGNTPAVRTLAVDTDPDALDKLDPGGVVATPLNRAGHYLKPRLSGSSLIEGWLDPQLLYKLPRVPRTQGVRAFGRLAFCDHARLIGAKLRAELAAAADPAAAHATADRTGLGLWTTRPRVYLVAGLGGGTGGGMVLDAAYAARAQLRRLGYENADVVGVLLLPPAGVAGPALGNAHAALIELHHFSRPGATFLAAGEEGQPAPQPGPPFGRCVLLTAAPNAPDPVAAAAELLRLELLSPVGRARSSVEEEVKGRRGEGVIEPGAASSPAHPFTPSPAHPTFAAVGLAGFAWPRAEVVNRAADHVARAVAARWLAADPDRARDVIPQWAADRWQALGLDPEDIRGRLRTAADLAAGSPVGEQIELTVGPLAPRGWRGRPPTPAEVALALDRLVKLVGPPAGPDRRPLSAVEQAVARTATRAGVEAAPAVAAAAVGLADDPGFRVAGAEEAARQFLATTDRLLGAARQAAAEAEAAGRAAYEAAARYAHPQAGSKTPSGADLMAAARRFPEARYEAVLARGQAAVYQAVRETLTARLAELGDSGRLLKAEAARWKKEAGAARAAAAGSPVRPVLPPGCESVDDAVGRVLEGLSAADLLAVDRRIGPVGLAAGGPVGVRERVRAAAREYLADRLAAADLGGMLANPGEAVRGAFAAAEPGWVGRGPWAKTDLVVVGAPPGPGRDLVPAAVPVDEFADTPDELVIVREYPTVPLSAVPHLGPAGHAAYRAIPEATQCTAHSRFDITQWVGPDEG